MLERVQNGIAEAEAGAPARPVIVTVHGTNDSDPADEGLRWWQRGSNFTQHLIHRLWERGVENAEIVPLPWSGKE